MKEQAFSTPSALCDGVSVTESVRARKQTQMELESLRRRIQHLQELSTPKLGRSASAKHRQDSARKLRDQTRALELAKAFDQHETIERAAAHASAMRAEHQCALNSARESLLSRRRSEVQAHRRSEQLNECIIKIHIGMMRAQSLEQRRAILESQKRMRDVKRQSVEKNVQRVREIRERRLQENFAEQVHNMALLEALRAQEIRLLQKISERSEVQRDETSPATMNGTGW
jgi:hypothetical protein